MVLDPLPPPDCACDFLTESNHPLDCFLLIVPSRLPLFAIFTRFFLISGLRPSCLLRILLSPFTSFFPASPYFFFYSRDQESHRYSLLVLMWSVIRAFPLPVFSEFLLKLALFSPPPDLLLSDMISTTISHLHGEQMMYSWIPALPPFSSLLLIVSFLEASTFFSVNLRPTSAPLPKQYFPLPDHFLVFFPPACTLGVFSSLFKWPPSSSPLSWLILVDRAGLFPSAVIVQMADC